MDMALSEKSYLFRSLIDLNIASYIRSSGMWEENACWGDESWPVYWTPGHGGCSPPPATLLKVLQKASRQAGPRGPAPLFLSYRFRPPP
ncbi:MAG: hypothetical protein PHU23_03390 [Dehalococcoidales bacterium]|nr:hypothetical protein [Dehalococcoidales bacterium]